MARDTIHNAVKNALIKDGWEITADPYEIAFEGVTVYADLAAERPVAAEKNGRKIAVEIKSFIGKSQIHDFERALGQYTLYERLMRHTDPGRKLYLAISDTIHEDFFSLGGVRAVIDDPPIPLLVVNIESEEVVQWVN
ncbi:MAG: element excision factor XisH family protein [Blastocatellales bacterium]